MYYSQIVLDIIKVFGYDRLTLIDGNCSWQVLASRDSHRFKAVCGVAAQEEGVGSLRLVSTSVRNMFCLIQFPWGPYFISQCWLVL